MKGQFEKHEEKHTKNTNSKKKQLNHLTIIIYNFLMEKFMFIISKVK